MSIRIAAEARGCGCQTFQSPLDCLFLSRLSSISWSICLSTLIRKNFVIFSTSALSSTYVVRGHFRPVFVSDWRRPGSNRQPPACKAGALPVELRPRQLPVGSRRGRRGRFCPVNRGSGGSGRPGSASMGPGGFEPPTSSLSGTRSNQLSYDPGCRIRPFSACPHKPLEVVLQVLELSNNAGNKKATGWCWWRGRYRLLATTSLVKFQQLNCHSVSLVLRR